jgi:hypothetical protein
MDPEELAAAMKLAREAGEQTYSIEGVTFEVVAKIRATRASDGKEIPTVAGPILLYSGDSLYRAMFGMASSCTVDEYKPDPDDLDPAARQFIAEIVSGQLKWQEPREGKKK